MSILVVGSVALDTVRTPSGARQDVLGGSATHFAISASFFAPVRLVAVVGEDFAEAHRAPLLARGVDLAGLKRVPGRTFRWSGEYGDDLNNPRTLDTQLNVFASFDPEIPAAWTATPVVFLANIDPELQLLALSQLRRRKLVACDTMNFWLDNSRPALMRLLKQIDLLIINDEEARQLSGEHNIVRASRAILHMGPSRLLIKRGEYGVLAFEEDSIFAIPAYPLEEVFDPTGAGDTFAGGCLGLVARAGGSVTTPLLRRAIAHGSVLASLVVERFGLERLWHVTPADVEARYRAFLRLTDFHTF
jgi:sugar/nucleoside kinase (ribokinase family)